MTAYTAWRITYQDSEQAARAAFERMCKLESDVKFWAGAAEEATLKLNARITRLEFDIERYKERISEMSKEITNYLNNGDIKLRARILELEQELDAAKGFYADLLVNSGNKIRRLEGRLNALCGPGTAETMRHE